MYLKEFNLKMARNGVSMVVKLEKGCMSSEGLLFWRASACVLPGYSPESVYHNSLLDV